MDVVDKALEALKVQIKKEIIDNYFAERVYLEEEIKDFHTKVEDYQQVLSHLSHYFFMFYEALHTEAAIAAVMQLLSLDQWPFYQEYCHLSPEIKQGLLRDRRRRGLTAWRQYRHLVFDIYEELQRKLMELAEKYHQLTMHLSLLNEDIDKFNASFDFGLIAAQIEAMEGGAPVISGGLLAGEREELSTRMRFKRQKLSDTEIKPLPTLPELKEVKGGLTELLAQHYRHRH